MKIYKQFMAIIMLLFATAGQAFPSSSLPGLNPDTSLPGLGPVTARQAPFDTNITHLPPPIRVASAVSQGEPSRAGGTTAAPGSAEHGAIKGVSVSLADRETIKILETDWLKEAKEKYRATKDVGFSGTFWPTIILFVVFIVVGAGLAFSGTFNKYGLNLKLYSSHGSLAILALILGIISFVYITRLTGMNKLEAGSLNLNMMASEMMVRQNNFLLYGIQNKEYGERQMEHIKGLVEKFHTNVARLRENKFINAEMAEGLSKMESDVGQYDKDSKVIADSFHAIEKLKERTDELSKTMEETLEGMTTHHKTLLADAESRRNTKEIIYQTLVVERLTTVEVELLKVSQAEVEFLLDKNPELVETMNHHMGMTLAILQNLEGQLRQTSEKKMLGEILQKVEGLTKEIESVIRDEAEIEKKTSEVVEIIHDIKAIGSELSHNAEIMVAGMEKEAEIIGIFLSVLALVMGTTFAILVTRSIAKPINNIVENLGEGSSQVSAASSQISSASQSLAEGASEQASSLEETSASLQEIASMTRQNADNAKTADSLMGDSVKTVEEGSRSMEEMVKAMISIKNSSNEISKIIKVIEEIAFQTNLLALNAAVEAARAGEHGKGFAVVAEEVRNLAQRSATASKDTASLIENAVSTSEEGGAIVQKVAKALEAISESTKKVGDLVSEITAASDEQSRGVEQVSTAVTQMDTVTQQNAATAEESASASEELNSQAVSMNDIVGELDNIISGKNGNGGNGNSGKASLRKKLAAAGATAGNVNYGASIRHHSDPALPKPDTTRAKAIAPEEVIPFGDDKNF